MKNRTISLLTMTGLAVTLLVSCTESFLDTDPIGKAAVETFYKTDEDATMAIMATYDVLQWQNGRDWQSLYMTKTLPSDEVNTGGSSAGDQPPYQELNSFTYGSDNPVIATAYSSNYYGIYRANQVINNVDSDTPVKEQIIAEAKFLRAYFYFELVTMFGAVPLNLHDLAPSEYSQPRASVDDIYTQIEKDLTEAISGLPFKSAYPASDKFRVTRGAAQALKGKVHLFQEEWSQAETLFDNVISSGEYGLVEDNFMSIFMEVEELGIESIFEVMYVSDEGYNWGNFPWGSRVQESNIHWQLTGPRADNYLDQNGVGMRGGWGFNYPTQELYDAFVAANDSVRLEASIWDEEEIIQRGDSIVDGSSIYQYEGFIRVKYGSFLEETNDADGAVPELNYGTNLRLIRYADVLLMAAEAKFRLGNENGALELLNGHTDPNFLGIRERAELPPVTASGDALMEAIKNERRLELAFEGVRFLDLIRWGDAASVLGPRGYVEGKHNLYPIPDAEMISNSAITENNPNY